MEKKLRRSPRFVNLPGGVRFVTAKQPGVPGLGLKYIGKDVLKAVVRKETLGKQWRDEITEELMRDDFAGLPAVSRRAGRCGSDMVHLLARRRSTICCLRWRITLWESRGSILLMIVVLRAHCLAGRAEGT